MDDGRRSPIVIIWVLVALCVILAAALTVVLVVNSSGTLPRRATDRPGDGGFPERTSSPSAAPTSDPATTAPGDAAGGGAGGGSGVGGGTAGGGGTGGHGTGSGSVDHTTPSYAIGGTLAQQLHPGDDDPLDLTLTNLTGAGMTATHLRVTISQVSAPNAGPSLPCTASDFTVTQTADAFTVALGPYESTSLSARGVPGSQWPQIGMINSAANQDGCKGASLTLTFTGSSTVGP